MTSRSPLFLIIKNCKSNLIMIISDNNDLLNLAQNNDNKAESETGNDEKRKKSRIEIENDTTFKIYSGPQIGI